MAGYNGVNVVYRLSDNGYVKPKFPKATKIACLENAVREFGSEDFYIFVDNTNLNPGTKEYLENDLFDWFKTIQIKYYDGGSSAASWNYVFDYALKNFDNKDIVYFLEDDYWHLDNSLAVLLEGMDIADYVSLYDHADKYIPASQGGNMFIDNSGGETCKVVMTKSTHWKTTNSTTMTFATYLSTLKQDQEVWRNFTMGSHPNDFAAFIALNKRGRSLVTPIPSLSTHCEPKWSAPIVDWSFLNE